MAPASHAQRVDAGPSHEPAAVSACRPVVLGCRPVVALVPLRERRVLCSSGRRARGSVGPVGGWRGRRRACRAALVQWCTGRLAEAGALTSSLVRRGAAARCGLAVAGPTGSRRSGGPGLRRRRPELLTAARMRRGGVPGHRSGLRPDGGDRAGARVCEDLARLGGVLVLDQELVLHRDGRRHGGEVPACPLSSRTRSRSRR